MQQGFKSPISTPCVAGTTDKPCTFTVETKGAGIDSLGFAIEGPSQAEIHCKDRGDGICDVTYFPTLPGTYAVHVTCGDVDILDSPFMVPISPPGDVKLVYAEGPGLEPEGVVAGEAGPRGGRCVCVCVCVWGRVCVHVCMCVCWG